MFFFVFFLLLLFLSFLRFLNRGSMFVFSDKQFLTLLNVNNTWHAESLLDLGAGDGRVTEKILHLFNKKYATEQSPTMQWRLKEKGFL